MVLKCVLCGLRVASRTELGRHKVLAHQINKPHTCEHCGKTFAGKTNLLMHVRLHTGERPYACSDCGKDYADYSNCLKHVRSQHNGKASLVRRNFCGSCRHHFTDRAEFHNHGCQVPSDSNSTMGDSIVTYGDGPTVDESQQEGNFDDFLVLVEPDDLHSESDILPNDELIVDGQSGSEIINNNSGYTVKSRNKYLLTSSSRTAVNRRFPTLKRELIDCSSNYSTSPNGIIESEKLTGNKPVTTDCSCDLNEKLKTLKNHMDERFNDLSRSMIEIDRKLDLILSDKNSSKGNEKWHFTIEKHSD